MTEACPPFFHGPKELYFTMVLFMPVISRSKYLWHKEYLDDFKKIEAPKRRTDYKTFARGLGIVLTSIIVISIAMLISPMTISTPWLRNLWLIVLVGSLGLQIFLPYLVGLYSKDSSGWMFLLHLSVNLLFIFLIIFAVGFVMISSHASKYVIILVTGITALLLFTGDTFAYILVKHGSIEEWGMTILESLFLIPRYAIIGGFVPTVGLVLAIQAFNRINIFNYFIIAAIGLFGFYAVLYFLPTKRGKEMIVEANLQSISRVQKAIIYDETYYG